MNVGFVYDLYDDYVKMGWSEEDAAEFDSPRTIDAIYSTLQSLGFHVEKIGNFMQLNRALVQGKRWDFVFNVAEGCYGQSREAQVPALLDAYQIPYTFSGPMVAALTLNKAMTKRIIRDAGIPTAPFDVINTMSDIDKMMDLPWPRFLKPNAEGTGKGVTARSRVTNLAEFRQTAIDLLKRYKQPVLVESFLPGREFTVGLLGSGTNTRVIGVLEVILNATAESWCHSYHNKTYCETEVTYTLVNDAQAQQAGEVAKQAWQVLECLDGGRIDLRMDDKEIPCFMEVNPLAGLNPGHSDLPILAEQAGMDYRSLIKGIVDSCIKRYELTTVVPCQKVTT